MCKCGQCKDCKSWYNPEWGPNECTCEEGPWIEDPFPEFGCILWEAK